LFCGGGVAGYLTLDPLQSVSELPQGVPQRFSFLFGAAGLVTQPSTFVGKLPPP